MGDRDTDLSCRLIRAFERRHGKSDAEIWCLKIEDGLWRVRRTGSATYMDFDTSWWRIRHIGGGVEAIPSPPSSPTLSEGN